MPCSLNGDQRTASGNQFSPLCVLGSSHPTQFESLFVCLFLNKRCHPSGSFLVSFLLSLVSFSSLQMGFRFAPLSYIHRLKLVMA